METAVVLSRKKKKTSHAGFLFLLATTLFDGWLHLATLRGQPENPCASLGLQEELAHSKDAPTRVRLLLEEAEKLSKKAKKLANDRNAIPISAPRSGPGDADPSKKISMQYQLHQALQDLQCVLTLGVEEAFKSSTSGQERKKRAQILNEIRGRLETTERTQMVKVNVKLKDLVDSCVEKSLKLESAP